MREHDNNPLRRRLTPATRMITLASGYLLLFLAILLSFEIIARKLFTFSLQGVDDFGGYVLAISTSVGLCYALVTRSHTRVDMLVALFPSGLRSVFHALAMVLMALLAVFATWRCSVVLMESIEFGSLATNPMQTPMWQPQSVWLAGMAFFAVIAVVCAVHAVMLLVKEPKKVNAFYGFLNDPDGASLEKQEETQTPGEKNDE